MKRKSKKNQQIPLYHIEVAIVFRYFQLYDDKKIAHIFLWMIYKLYKLSE